MVQNIALFIIIMGFWFGLPVSVYLLFIGINDFTYTFLPLVILLTWFVFCVHKTIRVIRDPYEGWNYPKLITENNNRTKNTK